MRLKMLQIESCYDCPHGYTVAQGEYTELVCEVERLVVLTVPGRAPVPLEGFDKPGEFPDWCPLSDVPAVPTAGG